MSTALPGDHQLTSSEHNKLKAGTIGLFGVLFIVVGLTITSFGIIGPIVAALLHNVGSLIVVFNSARLVRKGEELEHFHPEMETFGQPAAGQLTPKAA